MRYLKTFETLDKFSSGLSEIETFLKNNLAYILDEGIKYKVNFKQYGGRMNYTVKISKIKEEISQYGARQTKPVILKWDDIKDDFIPFLELLNEKYELDSYSPENSSLVIDTGIWNVYTQIDVLGPGSISSQRRWYSIEELIDDAVGNIDMEFISFTIKGKK